MRIYDSRLASWSEFPGDEIWIQLEPRSCIRCVRLLLLHHGTSEGHVTALNMNVWSFKWQHPTNSHVTCLNWFLLSTTTSPVWGCWRKHFTYFCPGVDCQCYWFFYVHSVCNGPLCDFLRCHRPVQVLKNGCSGCLSPNRRFPPFSSPVSWHPYQLHCVVLAVSLTRNWYQWSWSGNFQVL